MSTRTDSKNKSTDNPNAVAGIRRHVLLTGKNGQLKGDCPLCGKDHHFYVNSANGLWDCKSCGEKGNLYQFLDRYHKDCVKQTTPAERKRRGKERGGFPGTFYDDLAFDGKRWLRPVNNADGKLADLRYRDEGGNWQTTDGCSLHLLDGDKLKTAKPNAPVYVCEGDEDFLALRGIISSQKIPGVAVGVPGAGTFKKEWADLFKGRDVVLLYDNDDPGRKGQAKAVKLLAPVAKSLRCVQWPTDKPDGYDVSDFLQPHFSGKKTGKGAWPALQKLLAPIPTETGPTAEPSEPEPPAQSEQFTNAKKISLAQCRRVFSKWLYTKNPDEIDIVMAVVACNTMPDDPLWLFLVGAPGGGKTELIQAVNEHPDVYALSTFTPASLISCVKGDNGEDNSLAPRLNGKILVVKDFTTILCGNSEAQHELFGILRDLYDGSAQKASAYGEVRVKAKFNVLAGVTSMIEEYTDVQSQLGARFLHYRVAEGNEREKTKQSLANAKSKPQMREELATAALGYLKGVKLTRPKTSAKFNDKIIDLAVLLARSRTPISRTHNSHEIKSMPEIEVPTRVVCQLNKLGLALAMVRGKPVFSEKEYAVLRKVVFDTMPQMRRKILETLLQFYSRKPDGFVTTDDIAKALRLNKNTVKRDLEELYLLKLIEKEDREAKRKPVMVWKLSRQTYATMTRKP